MNDSNMEHGCNWKGQNPRGWLVSEKLDGCRAYWDGSQFWTRSGNVIAAPDSMTHVLPRVHLDGELWAGRGRFSEASVAVRHGKFTAAVRFVCFDAPQVTGDWQERIEAARAMGVECVRCWRCDGEAELLRDVQRIVAAGGEGLMIRKPWKIRKGRYIPGRNYSLCKVKPANMARTFGLSQNAIFIL
jgi:DNA ligase-1